MVENFSSQFNPFCLYAKNLSLFFKPSIMSNKNKMLNSKPHTQIYIYIFGGKKFVAFFPLDGIKKTFHYIRMIMFKFKFKKNEKVSVIKY